MVDTADSPLVTVIVPAYNRPVIVCRALDSVLAQAYRPIELIVVDDGSTDHTGQEVEGWIERNADPRLMSRLLRQPNQGAPSARNRALQACRGQYVMFLDSDDFIEGALLEGLVAKMSDEEADIGFGPILVHHEPSGRRAAKRIASYSSSLDLFEKWFGQSRAIGTCSVLWKTDFIRNIGGWREQLSRNQDGELVNRAVLRGAKFCITDKGCGVYIDHASGRISTSTDNFDSLFEVAELLLAEPSTVISQEDKQAAGGRYYYHLACRCFANGRADLGDVALGRARALGFRGHVGPARRVIVVRLLGLRRTYRALNFLRGRRP